MKLTILTRNMVGREKSLQKLINSMSKFDVDTFDHIILKDTKNRGMKYANSQYQNNKDKVKNDYCYMMDDDDIFTIPTFSQDLIKFIKSKNFSPDIIMMKFKIVNYVQPLAWGEFKDLKYCGVGTPNFCVKKKIWLEYIDNFKGKTGADWNFIKSMRNHKKLKVVWWDKLVGSTRPLDGKGCTDDNYPTKRHVKVL